MTVPRLAWEEALVWQAEHGASEVPDVELDRIVEQALFLGHQDLLVSERPASGRVFRDPDEHSEEWFKLNFLPTVGRYR